MKKPQTKDMTNGYILEIRTSSSSPGPGELGEVGVSPQKSMNRTDRLKAQFKGIDSKDNDLTLRMSSRGTGTGTNTDGRFKRRHGGSGKHHGRKSSSHSLDKYIKFTVKRSGRTEDDLTNRMTKFMFIFLSVGLFWHVLNNVDPIGKAIGGGERLREMNDVILREYYKVTDVINRRRYRIRERLVEKHEGVSIGGGGGGNGYNYNGGYNVNGESLIREGMREVVLKVIFIVEKVFYEVKLNREECFIQDLISLFYLGVSVFIINEIYWRIYHEIEESLMIIPHLGVQVESILIKENIWQVLKNVIGLRRILFNMNMGMGVAHVEARQQEESPAETYTKEKGVVINKQFVPMDYVKDIVINEGFKGFEVVFYMTLIMEEGVVVMNGSGHAHGDGDGDDDADADADNDRRDGTGLSFRDTVCDTHREPAEGGDYSDSAGEGNDGDGAGHARKRVRARDVDGRDGGDAEQTKLKMIVVFPNLLPRRAVLETVFRKSREYLKR